MSLNNSYKDLLENNYSLYKTLLQAIKGIALSLCFYTEYKSHFTKRERFFVTEKLPTSKRLLRICALATSS